MITFRSFIQRKSRPVVSALGSLLTFRNVVLPLLFGTIMVCTEVAHVHAGPKDGNVVAGDANIVQLNPKLLEIIQASDKVIIDWRSFSIDWDELVRFLQPDSDSIALNRVNGDTPSYILGQLTADGRVMLINPNGVLFGDSAVVDIGSLVATTIDIRNEDFMAGDYNFDVDRASGGTVVNRGRITAAEGGIVALVAPGVENSGVIVARLGRVALASGNSFALDFYGDRLIQIGVDDSVAERLLAPDGTELKALVDNSGEIYADGGTVMLMAASVAKDVVDYAINMEGIIKARTATERNGQIVLEGAGEGIVRVTGTLDASGRESGDTGGEVKILGSKVGLVGQAEVDASGDAGGGEVLIGGNFQGRGPERNAEFTTIGREVAIQADALTTGDGGRVIVWSDRVTRFYGNISARGGSVSGDGGFAEISGKQHLQFAPNSIDLSAPNGLIGELLLDPLDIVISDGDGSDDSAVSMDNVIYFNDDSTATYNITPAAFEAIDADITLQALRDITVSSPIERTGSGDSTLSLQAGRDLIIDANITGSSGAHSFLFEADSPRSSNNDGIGELKIASGVTITSNNGDITLIGAGFEIDTSSSIDAGTGDIHIAPSRAVAMMISTAASDLSNTNLSNAEIGTFTTSGTIYIGTATTGPDGSGGAGSSISASGITVSEDLTISGSASLVLDSGGTTTLSADVSTDDGAITFIGAVDLVGDVTVNSGATGGTITFTSTVDGGHALTLDADGGDVNLFSALGGSTALESLTVIGGQVNVNTVATNGNINIEGSTGIALNGATYASDNGDITLGGAGGVTISGSLDSTVSLQAGGDLTINTNITGRNGAHSLIFEADSPGLSSNDGDGTLTIASGVTITSNNGDITLIGAGFEIDATSSINAGTGDIHVAPSQAVAMTISTTGNLSNAEIGRFTTSGTIYIGTATTGPSGSGGAGSSISASGITVSQDLTISGSASLVLRTGGDITVSSAIDVSGGADSILTLQAGRHVTINADITGSNGAHSLIFEADSPGLSSNDGTGTLTIAAGVTITSNNGDITLIGAEFEIDTASNINPSSSTNAGTGDIHVAPSRDFALSQPIAMTISNAATGNLSNAEIGTFTTSGTIYIGTATTGPDGSGGAGSSISASGITVSEDLTISGSASLVLDSGGTTTLNNDVTTQGGAITFEDGVILGANVTVNSGATGGAITFTSTVDGDGELTVNAGSGTVAFQGAVGGTTATTALRSLSVTGGTITLSANVSTNDGAITFTGAVELAGDVTVDSDADDDGTDGNITFTSTVVSAAGGNRTLTLDAGGGTVKLQGVVGGTTATAATTALRSLAVTGSLITLSANVLTDDGAITFTGAVELAGDVTVDSDADDDATDGNITFTSTVVSAAGGNRTLTLDAGGGTVKLQGVVGGTTATAATTALRSLAVTGGLITLSANVLTDDGAITFTGAVELAGDVTVDSDADDDGTAGNIMFTSTVDGDGSRELTLDAGGGTVDLQGAVGGTTKLASLTVTGGQVNVDTVATTGDIDIEGSMGIALNGATYASDNGDITFGGAGDVTISGSSDSTVSLQAGGNLTINTDITGSNGAHSLIFEADSPGLSSNDGNGTLKIASGVTITSNNGDITLIGAGFEIDATSSINAGTGDIHVAPSQAVAMTISAAAANLSNTEIGRFITSGTIYIGTAITGPSGAGSSISASSITVSEDLTISGSASLVLRTGGDITVSNSIVKSGSADSTLALQAGGNLNINDDITGSMGAHSLIFEADSPGSSNNDGTGKLTIASGITITSNNGDITLIGAEFDINATSSIDAGTGDIHVAPSQAVAMTISTTGNLSLAEIGRFTTTGTIHIGTATTGPTGTGGAGSSISATSITVSQDLTISGSASLVLDSSGATTLSAEVSTENGNITFADAVTLSADVSTEDGDITFAEAVTLGADVTVDSDADEDTDDGAITFESTVDGGYGLTLDADDGGAVELQGAVGATTALASLTVDGGEIDLDTVATTGAIDIEGTDINLNGASYKSENGVVKFTGPVDLHADVTVESDVDGSSAAGGKITFTSTVDGAQALVLNAGGGAVELQGAVGGTSATSKLASLAVTGGEIKLSADVSTDNGAITFTGAVELLGDVTVDSDSAGGDIKFTSTVDGAHALTVNAGSGKVAFEGAVGATTALASLTVDGGEIDLDTVATTGAIDIEGTDINLNGASYKSENGVVKFTGPVDLHADVTVESDVDGSSAAGGKITFTSTVDGAQALVLNAGGGAVELQGAVGATSATSKLASLAVTGGEIKLSADVSTDNGAITFTGAVELLGDVTVDSDSAGGDIKFTSTVDGAHALTVNAGSGKVALEGAVGATTALASLTVDGGEIDLDTVATTGAIDIEGTDINLNGASYKSENGVVKFTGPVDLHADVTVESDVDGSSAAGGKITFISTVEGAQALVLNAGGGAVELQGAVGATSATSKLASLAVTGGEIKLSADVSTDNGAITFTGAVELLGDVTVDSDSAGGDIKFTSTVDGAHALTVNAGSGKVALEGAVGATTALASLTVDGGEIDLDTVATTGAIDIEGTDINLNGASYKSENGVVKFTGPVDLHADVTVESDVDGSSAAGGKITFTSTVDGAQALVLNAGGGAVELQGAVGATSATSKLASLAVTGGEIKLSADVSTDNGAITFTGAVELLGDVTVDSDSAGGDIKFTSTVDGAHALTVNAGSGKVALEGAVGATTALASLTVDGGEIDLDTVATTGAIDIEGTDINLNGTSYKSENGVVKFTGPVDLHADVTVESDVDGSSAAGGKITFTSTVDGAQALVLNAGGGAVELQGAVGATSATSKLASLAVTGGEIKLSADVSTDNGAITFTGAVELLGDVTVDSDSAGGDIKFTSTVDGAHALTVNAGSGKVALEGAVGATTALASLTVDGGEIDLDTVATTGAIDIEGTDINLNGASYKSENGVVKFTGPVDLHADVTVESDVDGSSAAGGKITFISTVDGAQALVLNAGGGAVELQGAVGATSATSKLASLAVTGGEIKLSADVSTDNGAITFTGAVELLGDVTVDSDSAGGDIKFTSTVDGAHALTVNAGSGKVALEGAVGATTALASLTVDGGEIDLDTVATTGAIDIEGTDINLNGASYKSENGVVKFTGPVDLHADVTVESDVDGSSAAGGKITFTSTVDGAQALVLNAGGGAVELQGAVGATSATSKLASLAVTGGEIKLSADVSTDNGAITFTGAVELLGDVTVDSDSAGGDIKFTSTVDGAHALTVNAGSGKVAFEGAVGATTALASLTVDGGEIDLDTVATTGAIDIEGTDINLNGASYKSENGVVKFTGPVDLHADVTVESDVDGSSAAGGKITFTSTVDGAQALVLNAGGGAVELQGAVGATSATSKLASLAVTGGEIKLSADVSTDNGAITFTGAVELLGDVTVDSDSAGGDIKFTSTVDGAHALTVNAGSGKVALEGAVGATTALASLTVDGGEIDLDTVATTGAIDIEGTNIDLNGASYKSENGVVKFTGPVDLHADVTVESDVDGSSAAGGKITFTSTVDGAQALVLNAGGGAVELQGAVGGTSATSKLASLAVTGGEIKLSADVSTDNGAITFTGAVELLGDVTVDSDSAGGDIKFTSTVDGAHALTVNAGSGKVALEGAVGATTALASLTVDGGEIDLDTVATTGAIDIEGTDINLNGASYKSENGVVKFTGPVDLHADVTVESDVDGSSAAGGKITFTSTVDGAQALVLNAGGGAVELQGAVGATSATSKLASLAVTGGEIKLSADVSTDNGAITFTGAVELLGDVTVDSDSAGGDIKFTSTVDGAHALTVNAGSGKVALEGAVGATTALASLTVDGGEIDLDTVATTGNIDIEGSMGIALNGTTYASDNGDIILAGAGGVTISGSTSLVLRTGGDITVSNSIVKSGSADSTLALQAGGALTINADIIGRNGAHSFIFEADSPGLSSNDGTGTLKIASGVTITSNNGDITLIGAEFDIDTSSSINAGTGDIHVAPSQAVAMTISTTANLSLAEIGTFTTSGTIYIGTATTGPTGTGGAGSSISAISITVSEDLTISGSASLVLDSSGATTLSAKVSTDDGNITFEDAVILNAEVSTENGNITFADAVTLSADVSTDDGNITFADAVTLGADVTVDSDADDDGTGGDITFISMLDGAYNLMLNSGTGNIYFGGDVGSADKLSAITVNNAHDVTVATTMWVGSFTQTAGTGTTDLGLNTVNADTSVDVTTVNIRGKIVVGQEARLTAQEDIISIVEVGSLTIEASNAYLFGTVDGVGGRAASDLVVINNRGPGTYTMNGFIILGTGLGTRTYVELSSLPLAPVTPTVGVFTSLIPMLRASVNDSISGPYIVTDSEASSPLLTPQPGTEDYYEDIPLLLKTHDDEMVEME